MEKEKQNNTQNEKSDLFSNVWTIPNLLSALRIVMVPIIAVLYLKGYPIWAVVVLALSGLSDLFDGKIARRFNQVSALGKILDPVADKLTQITLAVVLSYTFYHAEDPTIKAFFWVFLLFIVKELVMLIGGAAMLALKIRPGAAELPGKIATTLFYVTMLLIVAFGPEVGAFSAYWALPALLMKILVVVALLSTFTAFASYMPETRRQVKERFGKQKKTASETSAK